MFKVLRDPPFVRLLIGAVLVLGALVYLSHRMAWPDAPASTIAGSYQRAPVAFLHVNGLPERVVLHTDGRMELFSAEGRGLFSGSWTWDEKERMIRTDDPRWDRQIRLRSTLAGPRLCMRINPIPLAIDHPEHDEEVDLLRDDAGATASGE